MAPPTRKGTRPNKPARAANTTRHRIIKKGKEAIERHKSKAKTMEAIEAGRARARKQTTKPKPRPKR